MRQRVHVITLAVDDLERAARFYRDVLGFRPGRIVGTEWKDETSGAHGAIAVFELEDGLILSLYPRSDLAKDAEVEPSPPTAGGFSLAQLVQSRDDVDRLLGAAERAGAPITPARDRPWGIYSGYFQDPDHHLWEIIHHPDRAPA